MTLIDWPVIAVSAHVPVGGNGPNPVYELGKEDGPQVGYFSGGKSSPPRQFHEYGEVRDAEFWVRLDPAQLRRMLAEHDAPNEAPTLTAAQTALREAESHVAERRQELQAAVLQARQSRSLADIARELGVSKQRVDQISRGK